MAFEAGCASGQGVTVVGVNITSGAWNKIIYPEGVFEPEVSGLPGTHRFTFNLTFLNFTASSGSRLQCVVRRSDFTRMNVEKTFSTSRNRTFERLSYTLKQSDPVDKHIPWQVENCSLWDRSGRVVFSSASPYGSPLNRLVYVHGNIWSRFDSIDDDAYLASRCFLGIPKRYFNNTLYCDYTGDVAFSVAMSRGMYVEGECHDGLDGMEGNGDVDCNDIYCQGVTYSCASHKFAGDPFTGSCRNGLCWETKNFGGHPVTYYYTRYVKPGGTLKVRFNGGRYDTGKPISFAITKLNSFTTQGSYAAPGSHKPPKETTTQTSYAVEDVNGYYGNIDFVMYLTPGDVTPGWNTFSLYMVQYGQDLLIDGIPFYVSANAPSNWEENEDMPPIIEKPCSDGLDNDLNYLTDCRDIGCDGEIGGLNCGRQNAYCEYGAEETCNDCFDNEVDGKIDCADLNCNGKPGNFFNPRDLCEYGCEGCGGYYPGHCSDGFNNDAEDGTDCWDATQCWGKGGRSATQPCPAYENNDPTWCGDGEDNDYDGSIDCRDYDCRDVRGGGGYVCPYNEAYTAGGTPAPEQCFDNMDNDLDNPKQQYFGPGANIDCADPDCFGMVNPANPSQECTAREYDPSTNTNLCDNTIDDDADAGEGWPGGTDCTDEDCFQKFGFCGPCPDFESYRWDSCLNGLDDDYDYVTGGSEVDCNDQACIGEFGGMGSQKCEEVEVSCDDGVDNDGNGKMDCADPNCYGRIGPGEAVCALKESSASLCTDNVDNDADAVVDCTDPDCWGIGGCSAKTWGGVNPVEVPYMTPLKYIDPTTVQYAHLERLHVNNSYVIRFRSSATYEAVIITLGDATDNSSYFPYNVSSCTLNGNPMLRWVSGQNVGQIQHKPQFIGPGKPLRGFDVTLTCDGASSPQNRSYPVTVTNLKNGEPEVGETRVTSIVYGVSNPLVDHLEIEPSVGDNVNLPYNSFFDIRAVPAPDVTGVSQCYFNISGLTYVTSSECILRFFGVLDDETLPVSASVEDDSGNVGDPSSLRLVNVNAMPKETDYTIERPFYRTGEEAGYSMSFVTALSGNFERCNVKLTDSSGSQISSSTVPGASSGNRITCDGRMSTAGLSNGVYYLSGEAADEDEDEAASTRRFFFICNDFTSSGEGWDCGKADFDLDGIADICVINGSVTTTTSTSTTLANETTTTIPAVAEACPDVCLKYYLSEETACSSDITCGSEESEWRWIHDDRGDVYCYTTNPERGYCCCPLIGLATTTTIPGEFTVLCINGVLDEGEIEVDCGGPCPPCDSCYNGAMDDGEEAIDCGGPCPPCVLIDGVLRPLTQDSLYIVDVPAYAVVGSNFTFKVVDSNGMGLQSYITYNVPGGEKIKSMTDEKGSAEAESSVEGLWSVDAKRRMYAPTTAIWAALPKPTPAVVAVASTSLLIPLLLALLIRRWLRKRKGAAATEEVARALYSADILNEYAPLLVTEDAYERLQEMTEHLRSVKLTDAEKAKAEKLAHKHGLTVELGELLVAVKKVKAEKLITGEELMLREYNLTKIIPVWDETRGRVTLSAQP
ncbi:MAG: hypothetical protein V1744_00615 [Candidatus Altiarchaeota archaeon]